MNERNLKYMKQSIKSYLETLQTTQSTDNWNFFEDMFNWTNERYLHSNFISMLLSQYEKGRNNYDFLKIFLDKLLTSKNMRLLFPEKKCKVTPNITNHSEHEDIDILIKCQETKSAIIIENKTLSHDRKVNVNGKWLPQLLAYGEKLKNNEGIENIIYSYLTPRGFKPSNSNTFEKVTLVCIGYDSFIIRWLEHCLKNAHFENENQKKTVQQYKSFIANHLNNPKKATELRNLIKTNLDEAKALVQQHDERFKEELIHVKWEVIYEILQACKEVVLENLVTTNNLDANPNFKDLDRHIHELATELSRGTKARIKFTFRIKGAEYYICNDPKGFTIGQCASPNMTYRHLNPFNRCNLKDFCEPTLPDYAWNLICNDQDLITELQTNITCYISQFSCQ